MYKVLLVDDEPLIRERLKHCIEWSSFNCSIIGEAENGEKALNFIQNNSVDLAIIDINMPLMDGLELARILHNEQKNLFITFLTGYEKFEYAKRAVQLEVFDYLLKPVRAEDLTEMLQKFKNKKETENLATTVIKQGELKSYIFYHLLNGPITAMISQAYHDLFPLLKGKSCCFLLLSPDEPIEVIEQLKLTKFVVNYLSPSSVYPFELNDKIFLPFLLENVNPNKLTLLLKELSTYFNTSFSIGFSPETNNLKLFGEIFQKAKFALHNRLTQGPGKVHFYAIPSASSENIIMEKINKLSIFVKSGNEELSKNELENILHLCKENQIPSIKFFSFIKELISSISKGIDDFELKKDYFIELNHFEKFTEQFRSIEEIKNYLMNLLIEAISISQQSLSELKSISVKAINLMEESFRDCEIGLSSIADHLHVNPSYLSRIFKKETGTTIIEYLTKIRMENARQLLLNGCKNIQFVAEMTGYNDPHYFSRCFKKYYQVPPSRMI
ncbi:response regulator transcription factor [Neobacillus sp. M.A.Huq-85]